MNFKNKKIYKIDNKYIAIKYYLYEGDNKIYIIMSKNKCFAEHMHGEYSFETPTIDDMYLHNLKIEKDFYITGKDVGLRDLLRLNVVVNDFVKSLNIYFGL